MRPFIVSHTNATRLGMLASMTRHAYIADSLGERIRRLRQERGWTQTVLADRVGCTKRAIIYYEKDGKYPPAPILAAMAGAFGMTLEKLMAPDEPLLRSEKDEPNLLGDPDDRRLWKKMKILKSLPERDQQAIIRMLDTMAKAHEPATATG